MYRFDMTLHARPPDIEAGPTIEIEGNSTETLKIDPRKLSLPMPISFEDASERLAQLPRLYVEPDGSFVWVADAQAWQVDGNLYDRDGRLIYVELKGNCPRESFDQLISACGWPDGPMIFQLRRYAVFLSEETFRRFASSE